MKPSASPPSPAAPPTRAAASWAAAIALVVALLLTQRPEAAVLEDLLVPDAVEYAATAQRLATTGRFEIVVDGVAHPSRYPPTFAALLVPAYWIRPDDLLAGLWACRLIWAAGCAAFAYAATRRIGAAGALAVVALLNVHPLVRTHASTILSDAPSLGALLAILAVRLRRSELRTIDFALAGVALAVGAACRSTSAAFALAILPALYASPRRLASAAALFGPAIGLLAANAIYNRVRFGSFGMNGYVYWVAMPYARLDYVFFPTHVPTQLRALAVDAWFVVPAIVGAAGAIAARFRDRELWLALVRPTLLATLPLGLLHLFYFYVQERLFLPAVVAGVICGGGALAAWLNRSGNGRAILAVCTVALILLTLVRPAPPGVPAIAPLVAQFREVLPDRCRVITSLDPVTFDALVGRGTGRQWVAAEREQEYASKLVIDHRPSLAGIPRPPPLAHRAPQLLAQGARLAVSETAEDDALLDRLADPAGPPVFVDRPTVNRIAALRPRLARRFAARPVPGAPSVIECVPLPAATRATTNP